MSSYLLLWFSGPLQSWGYNSCFDSRYTLSFPTKSGIFGLLCAALGFKKGTEQEKAFLSELSELDLQIISYVKRNAKSGTLYGQWLCDFHMVGSGYENKKNSWQSQMIPKTNNGKTPTPPTGPRMTYRYFLQDVTFAILLEVPWKLEESVSNALKNPVWDLHLGRKCCVPDDFIYQGCFKKATEALEASQLLANARNLEQRYKVLQGVHDDGEVLTLRDVPLKFGKRRDYGYRKITVLQSISTDHE